MTFAHVKDFNTDSNSLSFSITPAGVGDLIVWEVENITGASNTSVCTGISATGGNVTWSTLGSSFTGTTNASWTTQLFLGKVVTAAATTLTFTWSGTAPAAAQVLSGGIEFSTTAGFSSVTLDVQGHVDSAGTNTWPSLTPNHGSGELYFGYMADSGSFTGTNGTPAGYTYMADNTGSGMAYNVNCPNSATGAAGTDGGSLFGLAALLYEASATNPGPPFYPKDWPAKAKLPHPPIGAPGIAGLIYGALMTVPPGTTADTSYGTGRVMWSGGGPVRNPQAGPPLPAGPLPNRPAYIVTSAGWRNAGHSR